MVENWYGFISKFSNKINYAFLLSVCEEMTEYNFFKIITNQ